MSETLPAIAPHSRLLRRGSLDGRSTEGRFCRAIEARLTQQVQAAQQSEPTFAQILLIRRISRAMLRLELLDGKQPLTDHDLREASSLDGRVRCGLKELLGVKLKPAAPSGPSLADIVADIERSKRAQPDAAA